MGNYFRDRCTSESVVLRFWEEVRCGGDVDALTLAVPLPHTVVGGHLFPLDTMVRVGKKVFARVELRPGVIST